MIALDEITPEKGQRAILYGGSRSGKSVLLDHLAQNMVKQRPNVEELLLDSKPRFRAEIERVGPGARAIRDAGRHYNDWEKGPVVPGSYKLNIHEPDLRPYWKPKDPCRVVIAQTADEAERPLLLEIANKWYEKQKGGADRVLIVDELLDFYHGNGVPVSRYNVPQKVVRAGGERGFSALFGAQRPKGIPIQVTEELSILYLFHLRYEDDMKYLYQNGVPTNVVPPDDLYAFRMIRINPGGRAEDCGMYRLTPDPSYLAQLSDT